MKRLLVITAMLTVLSASAFAASDTASHQVQINVNEVVLIDLDDTVIVTLSTVAPAAGGQDPTGSSDTSKILQYTSLVASGTTRNITAAWGGGDSAPAGTELLLEATSVPGGCGTAAGQITVSGVAQNLITSIGSCATGTGASGAQLQYDLGITAVGSLVVGASSTVTITFTLTDAA